MNPHPFPFASHPLTQLYLIAVKAKSQQEMRAAMDIARGIEEDATEQTIAACKLAAEVLLERR